MLLLYPTSPAEGRPEGLQPTGGIRRQGPATEGISVSGAPLFGSAREPLGVQFQL